MNEQQREFLSANLGGCGFKFDKVVSEVIVHALIEGEKHNERVSFSICELEVDSGNYILSEIVDEPATYDHPGGSELVDLESGTFEECVLKLKELLKAGI